MKVSFHEFDINLLYCVSLPGYTLMYTGINLQTLQYKHMIFLHEKIVRGGITSLTVDRYVVSDDNEKIIYIMIARDCIEGL